MTAVTEERKGEVGARGMVLQQREVDGLRALALRKGLEMSESRQPTAGSYKFAGFAEAGAHMG